MRKVVARVEFLERKQSPNASEGSLWFLSRVPRNVHRARSDCEQQAMNPSAALCGIFLVAVLSRLARG